MKSLRTVAFLTIMSAVFTIALVPYAQARGKKSGNSVEDVPGLIAAGIAKANAGDPDSAIQLLRRAGKASGKDFFPPLNRGRAYLLKGDLRRAEKDLNKAIELNSRSPEAYLTRGVVRRLLGEYSKAEKDLSRAVSLDNRNAEAYMHRAALYYEAGMPEKSLKDLGFYLQLDPRSIKALGNRACILQQMGCFEEALKDLAAVLAIDPSNLMAHKYLGFVYTKKRRPDQAIRWYKMAMKLEKNKTARMRLKREIAKLSHRIARK